MAVTEQVTKQSRRGLGLVISSPSGAGKTTLSKRLAESDANVSISVSVTTRPPRTGERDGAEYWFVHREQFDELANSGSLLEHAKVFGHRYGTPGAFVREKLDAGGDLVFDIDWQGARQLRDSLGNDVVLVFLLPPSMSALQERLRGRALDSAAAVGQRMALARKEISHWNEYDYVLVNDDLEKSFLALRKILEVERKSLHRQFWVEGFLNSLAFTGNQ